MESTGDCQPGSCPEPNGFFAYDPSAVGSAVLQVGFAVLLPYNLYAGCRYRTPLYSSMIVGGLLFEIMGYAGRFMLRADPASQSYFAVHMLGVIWGPTFLSAAICLLPSHLMTLYGREFSLLRQPLYLDVFFLVYGGFALAFQAFGVAFAADSESEAETDQGIDMLLVGLAMQLASLTLFYAIYYWFLSRLSHRSYVLDPTHAEVYMSSKFRIFFILIQLAAAFLLIRTAVRIAQFGDGLSSPLAQSEAVSLVLDGALVLAASIILTFAPAGAAFGSAWDDTSPFRKTHDADTMPPPRYRISDPSVRWALPPPYNQHHSPGSWAQPTTMYFPPPPPASSRLPQTQRSSYQRPPYEAVPQLVPFVAPPQSAYSPSRSSLRRPAAHISLVGDDVLW